MLATESFATRLLEPSSRRGSKGAATRAPRKLLSPWAWIGTACLQLREQAVRVNGNVYRKNTDALLDLCRRRFEPLQAVVYEVKALSRPYRLHERRTRAALLPSRCTTGSSRSAPGSSTARPRPRRSTKALTPAPHSRAT